MLAVSAWFDEASEARVRALWETIAHAGLDDTLHEGRYRPHITLGVWESGNVEVVSQQLEALSSTRAPVSVVFRALGVYPGNRAQSSHVGVYLTPTVTIELRKLHERVHATLAAVANGSVHRHEPGRWEPHCTVAPILVRDWAASAVDLVIESGILPLGATVNRIGFIETPAEIELGSFALRPPLEMESK